MGEVKSNIFFRSQLICAICDYVPNTEKNDSINFCVIAHSPERGEILKFKTGGIDLDYIFQNDSKYNPTMIEFDNKYHELKSHTDINDPDFLESNLKFDSDRIKIREVQKIDGIDDELINNLVSLLNTLHKENQTIEESSFCSISNVFSGTLIFN